MNPSVGNSKEPGQRWGVRSQCASASPAATSSRPKAVGASEAPAHLLRPVIWNLRALMQDKLPTAVAMHEYIGETYG
jgi:hypothetical protein